MFAFISAKLLSSVQSEDHEIVTSHATYFVFLHLFLTRLRETDQNAVGQVKSTALAMLPSYSCFWLD